MSNKLFRICPLKTIKDFEGVPVNSYIERVVEKTDPFADYDVNPPIIEESMVAMFVGMKNKVSRTGRVTKKIVGLTKFRENIAGLKARIQAEKTLFNPEESYEPYDKYALEEYADEKYFLVSEKPPKPLKLSDFIAYAPKKNRIPRN